MRRRRRTIYIGNQRWKIQRDKRLAGKYGECDYGAKTIRLCSSLTGFDSLGTLIHEVLHARLPDLSEEVVADLEETLITLIEAEGFRHADDHED
jgi:hypothetical protein